MKKLLLLSNLFLATVAFSQADSLFASYNFNACNGADGVEPKARGIVTGATFANDRSNNPGGSMFLGGAGGATIGAPSKALVSTGLTISAWIKPSTLSGQRAIVSKWVGSQSADQYLLLLNGNKIMFAVGNPGTSANGHQGNIVLTTTAWHHVVATWDTSGTHQIYVDGVLDINVVDNAFKTINSTSGTSLTIGYQSNGSRYFLGEIDDVKLFDQKLDANEVQTLHNENSLIQNNLVSHYNFDSNTKDEVSGNDPLAYGVAYAPDRNGNLNQALNISDDSTYLNLFDSYDGFASGNTGKITYSFWLNFKTFTGANQIILAKSADGGCSGNDRQFLFRLNTQNKLDMTVYGTATAGSYGTLIGSTTFTTGQWYHVVFAYDASLTTNGGVDKIKLFVNGVQETTTIGTVAGSGVGTGYQDAAACIGVGAYLTSNGTFCSNVQRMDAYFDELMIFNKTLNPTEITNLYNSQSPVGLSTLISNSNSTIAFPNPFSNKINANLELNSSIEIISIEGKIVFTTEAKAGELLLNTENWNTGMYIMKIKNEKGTLVQKLIKQ